MSMRQRSLVIGFTVGVWDLLHRGHHKFLSTCRRRCDFLHVGIMTDYWVQVQKGHDRPFQSLALRLSCLRKSGLADNIIVLDTLDMSTYLQMCHVWFMCVEQKNMMPRNWPGTVYLPYTEGISTTQLAEKLRNPQMTQELQRG